MGKVFYYLLITYGGMDLEHLNTIHPKVENKKDCYTHKPIWVTLYSKVENKKRKIYTQNYLSSVIVKNVPSISILNYNKNIILRLMLAKCCFYAIFVLNAYISTYIWICG